jgi:DNA invertase Pin-like site-specific DNA recombinase
VSASVLPDFTTLPGQERLIALLTGTVMATRATVATTTERLLSTTTGIASLRYTQRYSVARHRITSRLGWFWALDTVGESGSDSSETELDPARALLRLRRVSTIDQDLRLQRAALKAAGCDVIRAEKASGSRRDGRTELQVLLDFVQPGDTLYVTRIDRLARSMKDLQDIVHELKARGVALCATEQPIDTGTAAGKAFLDMLGVFAEFETNLRRERQLEGIAAAKARGVYTGRKPRIDPAAVRRLYEQEKLGPSAIAARLGIGRASVYRLLGKMAA